MIFLNLTILTKKKLICFFSLSINFRTVSSQLFYTCFGVVLVLFFEFSDGFYSSTHDGMCYSHYGNGVRNGAISIAEWGLLSDCFKVTPIGQ